jgi:hypothetical protein
VTGHQPGFATTSFPSPLSHQHTGRAIAWPSDPLARSNLELSIEPAAPLSQKEPGRPLCGEIWGAIHIPFPGEHGQASREYCRRRNWAMHGRAEAGGRCFSGCGAVTAAVTAAAMAVASIAAVVQSPGAGIAALTAVGR